jgi:hypothetical protein
MMRRVKFTVPQGVHVSMCLCGDLCKLVKSQALGDFYGMSFFMCDNYAYDPPKGFGNMRPKVLTFPCRSSPQCVLTLCPVSSNFPGVQDSPGSL